MGDGIFHFYIKRDSANIIFHYIFIKSCTKMLMLFCWKPLFKTSKIIRVAEAEVTHCNQSQVYCVAIRADLKKKEILARNDEFQL